MKLTLLIGFMLGAGLVTWAHAAPAKRVALVFDDGPRPADAEPLLALLAKEKVAVTFSLVGDRVKENPALARAIVAAGHELANHSQTHAHPRDLGDAALAHEVAAAQEAITAAAGLAPRWYWPPYLESDERVRAAVSRAKLTIYQPHHLVVSKDYAPEVPAAAIYKNATTDVRDGSVILFHEWRAETRAQLPAILAELRRQGCEFLTFSQLFDSLGAAPAAASVATHAPAVQPPASPADEAAPSLPAGGQSLFDGKLDDFQTTATDGNDDALRLTVAEVPGPGFTRALHVETTRDLSPPWAVAVHVPLVRAVKKGDTGFLRFHARALRSADETGAGLIRVVVQRAGANYEKSLENTVSVRAEWQEFMMPFSFSDDFGKYEIELSFGFGFKREQVEIGGIELLGFAPAISPAALPRTRFTYAGREADAPWRQAALARIEQIRKSGFVIEVKDAAGQPVPGALVRVVQQRSAFQFGSALQLWRLVHDTPDNLIYQQKVSELFNAGSPENDLKWPAWEGDWGNNFNQTQTLQGLRWMKDHGLHVRGHVLVWPGWKNLPQSIKALKDTSQQQEMPARVLKHIAEVTGATREVVQEWDVLNEPFDNHDLMALFGNDVMVDWFKAAAAGAAPDAPLYLNDYSNHDLVADKAHCADFYRVAQFLQGKGAPLGGLGLQGHISAQPTPPDHVLAALEAYAAFKLPIRITEFDIDTDDEQLQADYTRDFLILAYSHPAVVGVQHWGFWAKAHWRPRSALFRGDWSEKPAAKAYRTLVLKAWRTRLQGPTGPNGKVSARGFHGDYLLTVEKDGKKVEQTFTLRPEETKTILTVTLP